MLAMVQGRPLVPKAFEAASLLSPDFPEKADNTEKTDNTVWFRKELGKLAHCPTVVAQETDESSFLFPAGQQAFCKAGKCPSAKTSPVESLPTVVPAGALRPVHCRLAWFQDKEEALQKTEEGGSSRAGRIQQPSLKVFLLVLHFHIWGGWVGALTAEKKESLSPPLALGP